MNEKLVEQGALEKWARILLNHSLGGIKPGERVMLKGEAACWPLIAELECQVVKAGGIPDVYIVPPNNYRGRVWSAAMGSFGLDNQLKAIPDWHRARYESMDKYVEVLGTEDPSQFNSLLPEKAQRLATADSPFRGIRTQKPWVLTLFPTEDGAKSEGFPTLQAYADFLVKASISDPLAVKAAEEQLAPLFQNAKVMTVKTRDMISGRLLTLEITLGKTLARLCYGQYNWPDGEIFRSPDPRLTEGEIFLDLPVTHGGKTIRGIYLKFHHGVVRVFSAQEGGDALQSIVETDEGSHRLGETALGMNPGLEKVLKDPLYVEKVGGTAHFALGESYPECFTEVPNSPEGTTIVTEAKQNGAFNISAQHVDLVVDFRPGGAGQSIWLDDTLLEVKDGMWRIGWSKT